MSVAFETTAFYHLCVVIIVFLHPVAPRCSIYTVTSFFLVVLTLLYTQVPMLLYVITIIN